MSSYAKNTDNNLIIILDLSTILDSNKNLNIHDSMVLHMKFDDIPFFDYAALTSTSCFILDGITNGVNK